MVEQMAKFWNLVEARFPLSLWCSVHRNLPGGCASLHTKQEAAEFKVLPTEEVGGFKATLLSYGDIEPGQRREGKLTRIIDL